MLQLNTPRISNRSWTGSLIAVLSERTVCHRLPETPSICTDSNWLPLLRPSARTSSLPASYSPIKYGSRTLERTCHTCDSGVYTDLHDQTRRVQISNLHALILHFWTSYALYLVPWIIGYYIWIYILKPYPSLSKIPFVRYMYDDTYILTWMALRVVLANKKWRTIWELIKTQQASSSDIAEVEAIMLKV